MARHDSSSLDRLGITYPLIQAPMAGVATPLLAAAVSNAGGLGSIGIGASSPSIARSMILELQSLTHNSKPFNVNVFVYETPELDEVRASACLERLRPYFQEFGVEPKAAKGIEDGLDQDFRGERRDVTSLIGDSSKGRQFSFRVA